jgi:hypothetical protein
VEAQYKDFIGVCARRAVKQDGRGLYGNQFQIDRDAVPLGNTVPTPVPREGEALIVILPYDLAEGVGSDPMAGHFQGAQKVIHQDPAAFGKVKPHNPGAWRRLRDSNFLDFDVQV